MASAASSSRRCSRRRAALGLRTVFALTTTPAFFERVGFRQAAVSSFPRKVWNECFRCPKYANCDEVALSIDLGPSATAPATTTEQVPA